ncbi:hypothetical protein RhiirB3_458183 [Rhizophagus irregularis]|nr:hypothetical protein RhiirB3_458183 [Rhizophagus irregularis]
MKVVAAIHNNFVQKFQKRIWNPRSFEKTFARWSVDFYSGHTICYFVSIVASTLVGIYQREDLGKFSLVLLNLIKIKATMSRLPSF